MLTKVKAEMGKKIVAREDAKNAEPERTTFLKD
jgi:hypothetical protein